MSERRFLGRLSREPLYNTRAAVQMSGVPADTFRAWERRYGLPRPFRTSTNQRLYAEMDIGMISWLRDRTDEGMTISQAVQRLKLEFPDVVAAGRKPTQRLEAEDPESSTSVLRRHIVESAIAFDVQTAEQALDEALALFSIEEFCCSIVGPAMQDIGSRWSRTELSVASEHFATHVFTRRLSSIFALTSPLIGRGTIVAACPEGEDHELGLLILAIIMSRRGWRVVYLGASVPTDDLVACAISTSADLMCLSAATERAVRNATDVAVALRERLDDPPAVAIGGRAVSVTDGSHRVGDVQFLGGTAIESVDGVEALIERQ